MLLIVCCLLFVVGCWLFVVCCLLFVVVCCWCYCGLLSSLWYFILFGQKQLLFVLLYNIHFPLFAQTHNQPHSFPLSHRCMHACMSLHVSFCFSIAYAHRNSHSFILFGQKQLFFVLLYSIKSISIFCTNTQTALTSMHACLCLILFVHCIYQYCIAHTHRKRNRS